MRVSVKSYIKDVTKGLSDLQRTVIPRAAQQALNRSAATVRTRTVRAMQAELRLRNQAGLRAIIKVVKASRGSLQAEVKTHDKAIKMDETRNAVVKVTRKRIAGGRGTRKHTTVVFKGQVLDGAIQIELSPIRTIRKKDGGRYSGGQRSQRVAPVWAYSALQEMIHAKFDVMQQKIGEERFEVEFDRALADGLRRLRLS